MWQPPPNFIKFKLNICPKISANTIIINDMLFGINNHMWKALSNIAVAKPNQGSLSPQPSSEGGAEEAMGDSTHPLLPLKRGIYIWWYISLFIHCLKLPVYDHHVPQWVLPAHIRLGGGGGGRHFEFTQLDASPRPPSFLSIEIAASSCQNWSSLRGVWRKLNRTGRYCGRGRDLTPSSLFLTHLLLDIYQT